MGNNNSQDADTQSLIKKYSEDVKLQKTASTRQYEDSKPDCEVFVFGGALDSN
jgi:hypothetical protein